MSKKLRDMVQETEEFIEHFGIQGVQALIKEVYEFYELYDVDEIDDWVAHYVKGDAENVRNVRMIRSVYLVSRMAEFLSGKLVLVKTKFPNFYKRLEKYVKENNIEA
jgi:hypothetical protein